MSRAVLLSCMALSALVAHAVLARFPRAVAPDTFLWAGALVQAAALASAAAGGPVALIVPRSSSGSRKAPNRRPCSPFATGRRRMLCAARSSPLAWAAGVALLAALAFFAVPVLRVLPGAVGRQ